MLFFWVFQYISQVYKCCDILYPVLIPLLKIYRVGDEYRYQLFLRLLYKHSVYICHYKSLKSVMLDAFNSVVYF